MSDQASPSASGSDIADRATDGASQLAEHTQQRARELVGEAKGDVRQQADEQARRAADSLHRFSADTARMAESADPETPAGRWVQMVSDRTEHVARRLEQGGSEGVVRDIEAFARRQPGLFLLSAGALGFAFGRAMRAGAASSTSGTGPRQNAFDDRGPVLADEALPAPVSLPEGGRLGV